MKNKLVKLLGLLCVATLAMGVFAGCGNKDNKQADTQTTADDAKDEDDSKTDDEDAAEVTTEELLKTIEEDDADVYMILDGVGAGWAPTVMVLLNDGTFYCRVDYAGQANVDFCQGEYTVNDDQSITATGELYKDGSELVYEIAYADGTYSVSVPIPDTGDTSELTGAPKQ